MIMCLSSIVRREFLIASTQYFGGCLSFVSSAACGEVGGSGTSYNLALSWRSRMMVLTMATTMRTSLSGWYTMRCSSKPHSSGESLTFSNVRRMDVCTRYMRRVIGHDRLEVKLRHERMVIKKKFRCSFKNRSKHLKMLSSPINRTHKLCIIINIRHSSQQSD